MDCIFVGKARFNNPLVIAEINSLANTVRMNHSIDEGIGFQDGCPVTLDLDALVKILLNQIIACVPRAKQQSILIAHGLEEYSEELDAMWAMFVDDSCKD